MILGTREPKFVTTGGTTVLLEYGKILANEPDYRSLEHESVITNHRKNIHLGLHWVFQVRIHLFKHGANTAITKYLDLVQYLGEDVYLYQHKEGNAFKDSSGNNVLFRIKEVTPSYLETADFKDVITITFTSNELVDLSYMALDENTIFTEKGDKYYPLTDESGNVQTYEE